MNVSLTPALEKLVQRTVSNGLYNSASEVIREALRLFEEKTHLYQIKMENLKKDIAIGIKQANNGELLEGKQAFNKLRKQRHN